MIIVNLQVLGFIKGICICVVQEADEHVVTSGARPALKETIRKEKRNEVESYRMSRYT